MLQRAPLSVGIIMANLIVFALNHLSVLGAPYIMRPGRLDAGAWLTHWSHLDWWHLGMNLLVFYQIGPLLELRLGPLRFGVLMIALWGLLVGFGYVFGRNPSLGFSGIGLGLMTFAALALWGRGDVGQELLTWVGLNIVIGFLPGVSLLMHAAGAVSGALLWGVMRFI